MAGMSPEGWTVQTAADVGSMQPSPLTSLMSLSGDAVGGNLLAGYDEAFAE
jgi:hypothetical protein